MRGRTLCFFDFVRESADALVHEIITVRIWSAVNKPSFAKWFEMSEGEVISEEIVSTEQGGGDGEQASTGVRTRRGRGQPKKEQPKPKRVVIYKEGKLF